jgi:amino acid adenylation domain-containing protein
LHLEVRTDNEYLEIHPLWCTQNILPYTTAHYIDSLAETIRLCLANQDATIEDCIRLTIRDLDDIWRWNHGVAPAHDFCMHELLAEQAQRHPDKVAISSWDGDLTYAQIDHYSTCIASSLVDASVVLHDFVPICFEKSRWTIVAVLATMKAGATFVMMDPSLPLARLQNMATQVGAKTMLTSCKQHGLSMSILPSEKHIIVEADTFTDMSDWQIIPELPPVAPSTLMYIIFTSGSTGTPKGVKISHRTYTSSAIPRAKAVGYTESSRVLDFASYAFDVSIDSMLLTLGNGGCLCIPSDEDRMNDINRVIRDMRINYAGITPSVARILDPDVISSLDILGLGGEAASSRDVNFWGQDTRIVIGYGPCECTIGCTINSDTATGRDYISIGKGNGANIWIVDPNDDEILMPVGAVGELLVEGPIVGQGYLNAPEKTAAAFINNPSWLVAGHQGYSGRKARLYKTGDLGKYDPDGSGGIVFAGRKDTQVKLRGQRVELGEIESQLKTRLPSDANVIAEVIVPQGSGAQPTLVAFVASHSTKGHDVAELSLLQPNDELRAALSMVSKELAKVLPRYMLPTAYVPVNHVPVLISGKTDRKRLRHFGATIDLRMLDEGSSHGGTRELTESELRMRQAWGQMLEFEEETIQLDDNFFALGGDSLTAMRLVSKCRALGIEVSVASIFNHPTLSAMAEVAHASPSQKREKLPAFSMIFQPVESARLEAAQACGCDSAAVEDIYPCTASQESLFTFSLKSIEPYIAQRIACIPSHININVWKAAWESVSAGFPILRTHLVQLQEPGLQQVVLKEDIAWKQSSDLAQYLVADRNGKMELGQALARYAIVDDTKDGKRYMVWTVHHVLYDGWSEPIILREVSKALQYQDVEPETQMKDYVKYMRDTNDVATQKYWRQELQGAVGPQFPKLPYRDFIPTPDAIVERLISLKTSVGSPFTIATFIRGAWALVASLWTGSNDVVFGETLTGRDIPLASVENIVGPLIATVPVRIQIDRNTSVESYLRSVQQAMSARVPYQHMGWQNIRKVSRDAQYACETGTGLVIQPNSEYIGSKLGFDQGDAVREALHFNPYPLMVAFGMREGGLRACASFDSSLIEAVQMERMLAQLEVTCSQLTQSLRGRLCDISCLPEVEINQIWQWNKTPPLSFDKSTQSLRADASLQQGLDYPRAVVPWVCDPRNSSMLSPIGCVGELWLEGSWLTGEIVTSPPWLLAGSSSISGRMGQLTATGDLVHLRENGSIVFVGRKDNWLPVRGHTVDIADLESHVVRHLTPTAPAAATVNQTWDTGEHSPSLIVFVEQRAPTEDEVKILSPEQSSFSNIADAKVYETTICATMSRSLAGSLKKLDKFIQNSLPSYMAPSAYIVVDRLPISSGQIDRNALNKLACGIPRDLFAQLQVGMNATLSKISVQASLTASEDVLRSAWANVLRIPAPDIAVDDNFFRLGGDSVLAMKLAASLRGQGCSLTVADIFRHMRLGDAAKVMKVNEVLKEKDQPYKPFSTMLRSDLDTFLLEVVHPQLAGSNWSIRDICPVTDSQAWDVRATIQAPRTSIQYTMLYMDGSVNRERLLCACNDLVSTHDILRTVFIKHDSSFLQVVMDKLDASVTQQQADGDIEKVVTAICSQDIESGFQLGYPFLKFLHVEGTNSQHCLAIRLSHAQYDGVSLPRLLRDLETLYTGGSVAEFEPYPSYIARTLNESTQTKAITYWKGLLQDSALSVLVGQSAQATDKALIQTKAVDITQWPEGITTANLLTAAWALLLARRLQKQDVTFGSITSGRTMNSAYFENVQGPCYQFTPVRVPFQSSWAALDLLRFVQKQSVESTLYDSLGFEKISKQCTQWPDGARFFDSVVHHQDWEDFDTMPFAGGNCKVEVFNPHGDAPYPLKIISFVQGGVTHVGVVGKERDVVFVDGLVGELATTVRELALCRSAPILLNA